MKWAERMRILCENHRIARTGKYVSADGKEVTLPERAGAIASRTALLLPDSAAAEACERTEPFSVAEHTVKTDTVSMVLSLAQTVTGEIVALNFANAMVAGGGYIAGGDAQEESLCRSSLLYTAIAGKWRYYLRHWLLPSPLYSDRMLVSPGVPVIRSNAGQLLAEPVFCTFLTCAAVNRHLAKLCLCSERKITAAMERRIGKIVQAAAARKPEAIVLGAFGCGAFGNRRETVLPLFEAAVNRCVPDEISVYFAIP